MGSMAAPVVSPPTAEQVTAALAGVNDPEIRRPITDLGMVKSVDIAPEGKVRVEVYLTVAACPLRDTITKDVTAAASGVPGVSGGQVRLAVLSDEQRRELQVKLRGRRPDPSPTFPAPSSPPRGVPLSSANAAVANTS